MENELAEVHKEYKKLLLDHTGYINIGEISYNEHNCKEKKA